MGESQSISVSLLPEAAIHLAPQSHPSRVWVECDSAPSERLAGGDGLQQLPPLCEAEPQAILPQRSLGGHQSADNGIAALTVQNFTRFQTLLATATASARHPVGPPVASPRRPTDATEMPASNPIKCQSLYRYAQRPDGSVFTLYSSKQRLM
jgi:hypothetical protein